MIFAFLFDRSWDRFWIDFGSMLGAKIVPKSIQNRSRSGLKSERAKKQKPLKNHWFFNVFVASEGRKSIKDPSKSCLKAILREEAKTTPKNVPKSAQHGSKIGPSWGHVGLQSRLGPAQERRENDTENKTEKNSPNINLCEQGTGSALALQLM